MLAKAEANHTQNALTRNKAPFALYPQGAGRGCTRHSPQQHTLSLSKGT
jgi:hypothetical protein